MVSPTDLEELTNKLLELSPGGLSMGVGGQAAEAVRQAPVDCSSMGYRLAIGLLLCVALSCTRKTQHAQGQPSQALTSAVVPSASKRKAVQQRLRDAAVPSSDASSPQVIKQMPARKPNPQMVDTKLDVSELTTDGRTLRVGMRVQLSKRDRRLDPEETGHSKPLAFGPGQKGKITGFLRRHSKQHDVTFNVVVVRWDQQLWYEWDIPLNRMQEGKTYSGNDINRMLDQYGAAVQLPSFELATHPELLNLAD